MSLRLLSDRHQLVYPDRLMDREWYDFFSRVSAGIFNSMTISGPYTVVNGDNYSVIGLSGAFYTVTLGPASSYDPDFTTVIINESSTRGKRISPNGITSYILWPLQTSVLRIKSGIWVRAPAYERWAPGAVTFYVDPVNGLDTNDGLASGTGAFQTIENATLTIIGTMDLKAGATPTLQLADATYTAGINIFSPPFSSSVSLTLRGNATTPGNVVIQANSPVVVQDYASLSIFDMRLIATGGGTCISSRQFTIIDLGNIEFGAAGVHIGASDNTVISIVSNCAIVGDAVVHVSAANNSLVNYNTQITIASARTFTIFATASDNAEIKGSPTFVGAGVAGTTGVISSVTSGGRISTSIPFPGSAARQGTYGAQADGTVNSPFWTWELDPDTGWYRIGANNPGLSASGTKVIDAKSSGVAVIGTNTNDSAAAGWIGEFVSASQTTPQALTTATALNVISISLTAGDWDVRGKLYFSGNAATLVSLGRASISQTSATENLTVGNFGVIAFPGSNIFTYASVFSVESGPIRVSLSGTTTVYLVGLAVFTTNTCSAAGEIEARRVR